MARAIDRFDAYMASAGLNDNKVTNQLGLAVGLIGKSRKPGRDLSRSVIEKILAYYVDLNGVWLLTGEGEMLSESRDRVRDTEVKPLEKDMSERLLDIMESQKTSIETLLKMLQEKDEEISRLRAELDARKGGTASDAQASSCANVG